MFYKFLNAALTVTSLYKCRVKEILNTLIMIYTIINGIMVQGESITDVHLRFYTIEMAPKTKKSKELSLEDFENKIVKSVLKKLHETK